MGITLYCGLSERSWNTIPVPESAGPFMAAANRLKPIAPGTSDVMLDSGAFGDNERLSFVGAMERQRAFEEYSGFVSAAWVAYDVLIDEKWDSAGNRHKKRWSETEADQAIVETIRANEFLALADIGQRQRVHPVQGVTAKQQRYCADAVIPIVNETGGILGLGGWCIIGWAPPTSNLRKSLEWTFWDSMWHIIPTAARAGIQHIHIFGVMVADILGGLLWLCDQHGIATVSTDSSGPQKRPAANGIWGYADWMCRCYFPPGPPRGFARIEHVGQVRQWLADFRRTQYYKCPPRPAAYQLRLF